MCVNKKSSSLKRVFARNISATKVSHELPDLQLRNGATKTTPEIEVAAAT
jgi:hypothetical protein